MTYLEFVDKYGLKYEIKAYKSVQSFGLVLINTKILIYILRVWYRLSFQKIGEVVLMSRQLANLYYYDILGTKYYRNAAEQRWKELTDVGNFSEIE